MVAVLDFFHAADHLARATQALFGEKRSAQARAWFRRCRHLLRHSRTRDVLRTLTGLLNSGLFSGAALDTLIQVQAYFQRHYRHMQYQQFAQQQIPLGSGMVESACKWLIQQRFKGVGMRWREDGFNHLLLLRLAWVNQRFETLSYFPMFQIRRYATPPTAKYAPWARLLTPIKITSGAVGPQDRKAADRL